LFGVTRPRRIDHRPEHARDERLATEKDREPRVTGSLGELAHALVLDLAEESDGNAVGMGMVDFVPRRFARKVNEAVTVLNAVTARSPENAKWPIVLETDRDCVRASLATVPERPTGPVIVYVRDTLALGRAYVSGAALALLRGRDDVVAAGPSAPLGWSGDALESPFAVPAQSPHG